MNPDARTGRILIDRLRYWLATEDLDLADLLDDVERAADYLEPIVDKLEAMELTK